MTGQVMINPPSKRVFLGGAGRGYNRKQDYNEKN
jgi:hypothetical protein